MGLIEWIVAILGGIAINLIASELFAWGPRFSDWLTRWAVRWLPIAMQEPLGEEWAAHLEALHPLSRTLAAIGFALAACRIRVSVDRQARGALTVREWLALKPIVVVVLTRKGALAMGRAMLEIGDALESGGHYSRVVDLGPDMLIRSNLMAKARSALHRGYKRFYDKNLQPTPPGRCTKVYQTNSGDIVTEGASRFVFRLRPLSREATTPGWWILVPTC